MKILFVYPIYTPKQKLIVQFFINDQKILESKHAVRVCEFIYLSGLLKGKHFLFFIGNLISLFKGILWCDISVCWLGKLHAVFAVFFSKILKKKSVIIAGGDEATNTIIDGKPYGLYSHPIKKLFVWLLFQYADRIVAISKYNYKEILENTAVDPQRVYLVYHGFDSSYYKKFPEVEKENIAVTVGNIAEEKLSLKGFTVFVESAAFLPDVQFCIVGPSLEGDDSLEKLKKIATPNVVFTGGVYGKELVKLLSKASVYVQASKMETFGCAVAEAMLCECVPVVSNVAALPEVTGEFGFYINKYDPKELANKIKEALNHPELGKLARKRIIEQFPLEKRQEEILAVLEEILLKAKGGGYGTGCVDKPWR